MERETGIEPAPSAWKAEVLPLNYSRIRVLPAPREAPFLVEGGGLLRASCPPPLRGRAASRRVPNRSCDLVEPPSVVLIHWRVTALLLVEGGGFEPPKA